MGGQQDEDKERWGSGSHRESQNRVGFMLQNQEISQPLSRKLAALMGPRTPSNRDL